MKSDSPVFRGLAKCFLLFFSLLVMASCNDSAEKKETNIDSITVTDTSAATDQTVTDQAAALAAAPNINFPIFKIDKTDLTVPHGKKPSKIIIKFRFTNFANPLGSMTLLLYSAKSHAQHAEKDDPKEIVDKSEGTISIPKGFIFGNSEFDYSKLLDGTGNLDFSYLILMPILVKDDQGRDQLVFNITSYDDKNQPKNLGTMAVTNYDTKPSPPAPPEP
ncbi:MAG: hypothetical protein ABIR30_09185 [Chitinophagaceae bacterium]